MCCADVCLRECQGDVPGCTLAEHALPRVPGVAFRPFTVGSMQETWTRAVHVGKGTDASG